MTEAVNSIGKAVRHGMLLRATCRGCGNVRHFKSSDLMMIFGSGRDPLGLPFRCSQCAPAVTLTLIVPDRDRLGSYAVQRPVYRDGEVVGWFRQLQK